MAVKYNILCSHRGFRIIFCNFADKTSQHKSKIA